MSSREFKGSWHRSSQNRPDRCPYPAPKKQRTRFLPCLEQLESRTTPATLVVNSLADNIVADNVLTLREAIAVVNTNLGRSLTTQEQAQVTGTLGSNDKIQFSLPTGPHTITLTGGALSITKPLAIVGPGAGNLTIGGNNQDRVFVVGQIYTRSLSLTAAISGLTLSGGSAVSGSNNYGGGLLNFGTLTLSGITFSSNAAGSSGGGAIYNDGALTVNNSTFSSNSVTTAGGHGGGIQNASSATLVVNNCTFTGNSASAGSSGGAISNSGTATVAGSIFSINTATSNGASIHNSSSGNLTVDTSTFSNGVATSDGGGIDSDGTLKVSNSTFNNNSAGSEGGAIDGHGASTIINSTFVSNSAVTRGGAINGGGVVKLTNCTITGNRVTSSSGTGGGLLSTAPAQLYNTIVAGNYRGAAPSTTANDIGATVDSGSSFNLVGTGGSGGLASGSNGNQVGVSNPGLGSLASNGGPTQTVALLSGSPAINRGSNAYVTSGETDQRGLTRIVNGTVDIGAYEVQTAAAAASSLVVSGYPTPTTAGVGHDFTVTAKDALGNTATGYTGTVTISSSDSQAFFTQASYTFTTTDAGVHTFRATLKTAGTQSLTATDPAYSLSGSQTGIVVTSATASSLVVSGYPTPTTAGVAHNFSLTAKDAFGNTAKGYTGTIGLSSSDAQATFAPASYAFTTADAGTHTFSATFNTTGTQSLKATDGANSLQGSQSGIVVNAAASTGTLVTDPNAVFTVPVVAKPGYLQPVVDPVFGTQITRIAGDAGTSVTTASGTSIGTWGRDARHNYNLNQAWNSDSSLIYMEQPTADGGVPDQLYLDGNTYQVKFGTPSNMPGHGGYDQRWNPNSAFPDDVILAGNNNNNLYWFNVVTNTIDRTWTLPLVVDYLGVTKGNPSQNGQFICLGDLTHFFVVDMNSYPTQRIGPVFDLGTLGINGTVSSFSISPSGHFVVVHYSQLNGQAGDFEQVLKVDPTTLALSPQAMSVSWPGMVGNPAQGFVYGLGHEDMALDPFLNNADVMIGQEHCGNVRQNIPGIGTVNSDGIGHVVMVQLSSGAVTSLTDPGNGTSIAYEAYADHVSCRAILRPGWAYVSYYNAPGARYTDEIIAVKMDDSGSVERLANYHSDFDNDSLPQVSQDPDFGYRSETHPAPSPDGLRVIFASNWLYQGTGGSWIEDYVVDRRQLQQPNNAQAFAANSVAANPPSSQGNALSNSADGQPTVSNNTSASNTRVVDSVPSKTHVMVEKTNKRGSRRIADSVVKDIGAFEVK